MITKNAKTILFASLIAAMILPFSGMQFATAEEQTIADTKMVEYLTKTIQKTGKNIEEKTIEGKTYTVSKVVTQLEDNKYRVANKVFIDSVLQSSEVFQIIQNDDDTISLINKNLEINETFTKETITEQGAGYSSYSGAAIVLSDSEYGTPGTLYLYDNYNECYSINQGVMETTIRSDTIDVTWEGSPAYLHYCFYPHSWERGYVQYESQVYDLVSDSDQSDRKSSHVFTNTQGGDATYEVDLMFFYGAW